MNTHNRQRLAPHGTNLNKYDGTLGAGIAEHMPAGSTLDHVVGEYHATRNASLGNTAKKPRLETQKSKVLNWNSNTHFMRFALEPTKLDMNDGNFEDRKTRTQDKVSLREWITRPGRVIDEVESLHIFRQVLEFVDLAHSQGVVLRNVRPSCFVLSSLNRVAFIDSATSRSSSERSSELSTKRVASALPVVRQCEGSVGNHFQLSVRGPNSREREAAVAEDSCLRLSRDRPEINQAGFEQKGCSNSNGFQSERTEAVDRLVGRALTKSAWLKDRAGNSNSEPIERHSSEAASISRTVSGVGAEQNDTNNSRNNLPWDFSEDSSRSVENSFPLRQVLLMERTLYTSPEELGGATSSFASDIYSLGVLFFELFCAFTSSLEWSRTMSDLRHRILPPRLLSGYPKEAALCLWLLHPEYSARPKTKEILQCELLNEVGEALAERQAAGDIEDRQVELELLLDFLFQLQHRKQEVAQKLSDDISCLSTDIEEMENRQSSLKQRGIPRESMIIEESSGSKPMNREFFGSAGLSRMQDDMKLKSGRLVNNFKQLQQAYFTMRWKVDPHFSEQEEILSCSQEKAINAPSTRFSGTNNWKLDQKSLAVEKQESPTEDRLGSFFSGLCKYARYSQFKVKACLKHGDLLNTANMVCSLSFDRDEEYFATAGVSKRIKVFECDAVLNEDVDIHYPVVEMITESKLSSICWNSYIKNHIASSGYDGVVQLWDAHTKQILMKYKEHEKRAWSVDFSHADPTKLASGSDDGCVKLWSINQEASICTIRMKANICCVQFPANSAHLLAFGSADYKIYCYDLRHTRLPLCILANHNKAVSNVKFLDSTSLISASTDNTLKLWDIAKSNKDGGVYNLCALTYAGHTNEKNFVGLSIADGYIACGSETNEVFVYHKSLPMPVASHKFGSVDPISGQEIEGENGQFVSSVCWKSKSQTLAAANSIGNIKLLEMV
ncbi:hypothetical protein O6H91_13G081800 [Diphasiastrum complanatum]|uniref:Uncharacterized protein n=10 Tax=Diphasiastrum complanatum TaxID=34168 RepID=A0ACC2BWI4_DIPCM|nr:hypothetical protein O6H91_13G081800 [Diphasiastrum complanatum]KAJ7534146.1 hypothetical protein O6H91_13G081800 [Diphasiastrum complanatum]KAJ7534147.1 hypothetical protein O6H91_13G081800 [Diphasiastrum complanatum]KAJ7534148.1 hypothetical protein O6H91_13G081800 [Diphasiastrum complanatum]KAJ7534149.1 hypothetical protein O6H91_13G081800 [Diphasiastrum complanatum]